MSTYRGVHSKTTLSSPGWGAESEGQVLTLFVLRPHVHLKVLFAVMTEPSPPAIPEAEEAKAAREKDECARGMCVCT